MRYIPNSSIRMRRLITLIAVGFALVTTRSALAHCPLCTAGAGALAILAASLGVSSVIVGILIGAFALALALWLPQLVKKQYVRYQNQILALLIFIGTIVPIMPLVQDYGPLYISLGGEYGTPWHNTYTINLFLFGSLLGALIVFVSPYLSRLLTKRRSKQLPYQGVTITLGLLVIASLIAQWIQW